MTERLGLLKSERLKGLGIIDPLELMERWYAEGAQGILLGHDHGVLDFHEFSGVVMESLPRFGVKTVYLEESVTWQPDLRRYRETDKYSDEWDRELERTRLRWDGHEDRRYLYEAIRNQKDVELWFIDCPVDRKTGKRMYRAMEGKTRDEYMMDEFRNHPPSERFLVICGSSHTALGRYRNDDRIQTPLGVLIKEYFPAISLRSIMSIARINLNSPSRTALVRYFNEAVPEGSPPLALDLRQGNWFDIPQIKNARFRQRRIRGLFHGLIVFPHATYERNEEYERYGPIMYIS